ncbi:MAG: hypothetical protein D6741_09395 [Planctomycetota bacterium]|nr:MAG: hypothetical protein D6741_09395 [Planctomycetota bacterium]
MDTGWARCRPCDEVFVVPELASVAAAHAAPKYGEEGAGEEDATPPQRPYDARIQIRQDREKLLLQIPAAGVFGPQIGMFLFSLFWLGFVTFWTLGALGVFFGEGMKPENIAFACFSIPFWLVGIGMLGGAIVVSFLKRDIYFDPAVVVLRTSVLFFRRTKRIPREKVQKVRRMSMSQLIQQSRVNAANAMNAMLPNLELVYEGGTARIPCKNEDERRWIEATVNAYLKEYPADPRYVSDDTLGTQIRDDDFDGRRDRDDPRSWRRDDF